MAATAVVTGAGSGIGAASAVALAARGARVVLVDRDETGLAATAAHLPASRALALDVTEADGPARIVREALEAFGSLDVLVHAAGIYEPLPYAETPLESLDRQWRVNARAPFALTQAALPHLRGGGRVVFVSSIAGRVGFPDSTAYCATKGAVELLTRALALELAAEGVRVNAVAPGTTRTGMTARTFAASPGLEESLAGQTPARRIADPEEIAAAVAFLASDEASYVHGATLVVDGGWTAQ